MTVELWRLRKALCVCGKEPRVFSSWNQYLDEVGAINIIRVMKALVFQNSVAASI